VSGIFNVQAGINMAAAGLNPTRGGLSRGRRAVAFAGYR